MARRVESPTNTDPGAAADCTREAVLTMSPATIPSWTAPGMTAASPVRTPARAFRSVRPAPRRASARRERGPGPPNGPLGVVLLGNRGSPHGHDRIADELLDHAAVAVDQLPGDIEVAGEELANILRVTGLGDGGEPDQVGEHDRYQAAFRGGSVEGGAAGAATAGVAGAAPCRPVPHSPQNLTCGSLAAPQLAQIWARVVPHSPQNFRPGAFSVPQFEQTIEPPRVTVSEYRREGILGSERSLVFAREIAHVRQTRMIASQ